MANALTELISLQKRSRVYWMAAERLESEGWQYIQLTGRYTTKTHANAFAEFTGRIETIHAAIVAELSATRKQETKPAQQPIEGGTHTNSPTIRIDETKAAV